MLSKKSSALLNHVISKFSPEMFVHPVWVRFGRQDVLTTLNITDKLLYAVKTLQKDDPIGACQILLLCAVYQNYASQSQKAWTTIQNALALARQNSLSEEVLWALWGACAICFQQQNCKQAVILLEDMQVELINQNDWVLADFVAVIKESLLRKDMDGEAEQSGTTQQQAVTDLLKLTLDWLQQ